MDIIQNKDLLSGVSLNQIQVFLVAAECENFSRASRKLHMTQATISRSISNLEDKTGLSLFSRYLSYVKLTPAGQKLYAEWKQALEKIVVAVEISNEIQKKHFTSLRVGDNNELKGNVYLCPILQDFEARYPEVSLKYEQETLALLIEDLQWGKYDVVFCSALQISEIENAGLTWKMVFPDKLCIAVNNEHSLGKRPGLELEDLQDETIILIERDVWPGYYDAVELLLKQHGVSLKKTFLVNNTHSAFVAVFNKKGVLICDHMFYPSYESYFKKYDIEGVPSGVIAAWDEKNPNPYISALINSL